MSQKHRLSLPRWDNGVIYRSFGILSSVILASSIFVAGCDSKEAAPIGRPAVEDRKPNNPQQPVLSLDPKQIQPESGLAFTFQAPQLESEADQMGQPNRSPYFLMEDGKLLGPAHSIHEDIRKNGNGRWSHWGPNIFLSSSDGSDPRKNNRTYTLVK